MATDTRYITHTNWTGLTATEVTYPNGRQLASGYVEVDVTITVLEVAEDLLPFGL